MKLLSIFFAGFMAVLLSSCSTAPKPNYQQANESDVVQADLALALLKQLDAGHVDRARKIATIPVYLGMNSARFNSIHGLVSLTPEEKQEWVKVARETLDYMLRHTDEFDSGDLTVQWSIRGLRYFLTEPDDVRRIDELSERLAEIEKKRLETPKP
jgi:hypothetical protein